MKILMGLLILVLIYGLSWAVICGVVWLVTLCFALEFSLLKATGIWIIFMVIKNMLNNKGGKR